MGIEGLKYNLDNNINPEVQDFLADGILQTKEAKALTEIFEKNKTNILMISKKNLRKLRLAINTSKDINYLTNSEKQKIRSFLGYVGQTRKKVLNIIDTNGGNEEDTNLQDKYSDLENIDLRDLVSKYPREASIKNNNPAGLTWSTTFAKSLKRHGIKFFRGTKRPSREKNYYFGFPNMKEGMKAFDLLWEIKLKKMGNKTFGDFAKNWAKDWKSYKNKFGDIWNTKLSNLDEKYIKIIQQKQMKIESPGMYKELKRIGYFS